jgi:hypothetical protein
MASPGNGMKDEPALMFDDAGLAPGPGDDEMCDAEMGEGRGGIGEGMGVFGAMCGPVLTSVMRLSERRVSIFHSPHQSSSRTCGHTPSIM